MAPLPGTADDPSPDYLLRVEGRQDARAALDAAAAVMPVDGRSTAWTVAGKALWGAALIALVTLTLENQLWSLPVVVVVGVGSAVVLVVSLCERQAAITPVSARPRLRLAVGVGFLALVVPFALGWVGIGALQAGMALGVVLATADPVVHWLHDSGRRGHRTWPRGAEAFAILSVLARVESIDPGRLGALTGLDANAIDRWLERLRSEHSLYGGRRRHRIVGDERVRITVPGEQRLARMRGDLERLGSPVDVLDGTDQR